MVMSMAYLLAQTVLTQGFSWLKKKALRVVTTHGSTHSPL